MSSIKLIALRAVTGISLVLTILGVAQPAAANSLLVDSDCNGRRSGIPNVCNFDPTTGLHWLGWSTSRTPAVSYEEMLTLLSSDPDFIGFRYATESEVLHLLQTYTNHTSFRPTEVLDPGDPLLLDLIIDMDTVVSVGTSQTSALVAAPAGETEPLLVGMAFNLPHHLVDPNVSITFGGLFPSDRNDRGHALVLASVPEPDQLLVMSSALLGLLLLRIRSIR